MSIEHEGSFVMEPNQTWARRRRDRGRWQRSAPIAKRRTVQGGGETLQQWRRILGKIESDAARYRFSEVAMLIGTAILAIEDVLDGADGVSNRRSS
jgi:hypothetical protein